jgi:hypothetical protein
MIAPARRAARVLRGADVEAAVRSDYAAFARSRLLVVENTNNRGGGSVWPLEKIRQVTAAARKHGLRTHLDGAPPLERMRRDRDPPASIRCRVRHGLRLFQQGAGDARRLGGGGDP